MHTTDQGSARKTKNSNKPTTGTKRKSVNIQSQSSDSESDVQSRRSDSKGGVKRSTEAPGRSGSSPKRQHRPSRKHKVAKVDDSESKVESSSNFVDADVVPIILSFMNHSPEIYPDVVNAATRVIDYSLPKDKKLCDEAIAAYSGPAAHVLVHQFTRSRENYNVYTKIQSCEVHHPDPNNVVDEKLRYGFVRFQYDGQSTPFNSSIIKAILTDTSKDYPISKTDQVNRYSVIYDMLQPNDEPYKRFAQIRKDKVQINGQTDQDKNQVWGPFGVRYMKVPREWLARPDDLLILNRD